MKKYVLNFAFIIVCIIAGCKKEKVIRATNISNQQAATMVATALATNANGLVSIKNDVTLYARTLGASAGKGCGVIDSFAVARQEPASSLVKYNYAMGYHYTVNCDGSVPNGLTSNTIYNGSFDAATLGAINTVACKLDVVNLADAAAANYHLSGRYQSSGSFQTVDETLLSGNNLIIIETGDLMARRSNRGIVSGNATVTVSGGVKNKNTFSYSGTISFNDTGVAKLTLEGVGYNINLTTAEIVNL